jgi:hypothetical protein
VHSDAARFMRADALDGSEGSFANELRSFAVECTICGVAVDQLGIRS